MFSLILFFLTFEFCRPLTFELIDVDQVPLSNGNVYLSATGASTSGCGSSLSNPCRNLADFLNNNGSNYLNNDFIFSAGTYVQGAISVPSTAPSQRVSFTGSDDNVIIQYNTTSNTYGFVISMQSSVTYTRLNYEFSHNGPNSTDRTLIRTNGGTCIASNCTFTASTSVKAAFFRNAYGGTINLTRCVFKNVNWIAGAYDFGCLFVGGNISGDSLITNCTFTNLTSAVSTPILPFYVNAQSSITTVGNITISGGLIEQIFVPKNATVIQISTLVQYAHFTSVQGVTFRNIIQTGTADDQSVVNGLIFSLTSFNLFAQSQVFIQNNTFDSISGLLAGGVIYCNSSNVLSLSHNTFKNCSTSGVGGGAIFFDIGTSFELINCTFVGCGVSITGSKGGAIFINGTFTGQTHKIDQCRFYNNNGEKGKDIYYNSDSRDGWDATFFSSTCSNCTANCAQNAQFQGTDLVVYTTCVTEVYITGNTDNNVEGCAAAGSCGTLQYVLNISGVNYPFIGIGTVSILVSGVSLVRREETITGDSSTSSGLTAASASAPAISVDNSAKLTLNNLALTHVVGGEFLEVKGEVYITGCVVTTTGTANLTKSFLHLYEKGQTGIIGVTFSNLSFAAGSNAIYTDGGILTIASSSFRDIRTAGNGGAIYAKALTSQDAITIDDSCTFINCAAPTGKGGAIYLNLTVGSPLSLLSTIFFNNTAGNSGGAIHIDVSNHTEIGNFRFNNDVHFFQNINLNSINNSVHISIINPVPGQQFPCFTPVYNFSRYDYFDFTLWTVSVSGSSNTSSVASILNACRGRCTDQSAADCPTTVGCWVIDGACVNHPCLEYSASTLPPCSGICVESDYEDVCIIDPCNQLYNVDTCEQGAGCGLVNGKCIKASVSVNPGGDNQIRNTIGKVPTYGKIYLTTGNYTEYGIVIGNKEVWIGSNSSNSQPTIAEYQNGSEPISSMVYVNAGGTLELNNLILTARPGFQNGLNASLIYVTAGRLTINNSSIVNRWGTFCAIYAENPRETIIRNCIFRNITHDTPKGGAGLGINMLGENAYTLVQNTTFTDVWVQGTASNTRFGGALWLEAHGTGHVAEVILCKFERINTTDNAGALELYSDDSGGAMLCEHTEFVDCFTTKGGAASSSRGRPVVFRNCTFTRCAAGTAGGALYNGGRDDCYVENCLFSNCSARKTSANVYGGAAIDIYTSGTTIIADCRFDQCFIHALSGVPEYQQYVNGIAAVVSSFRNCSISSCTFTSSKFQAGYVGRGDSGALQVGGPPNSTLVIDGCTFLDNVGNSDAPLSVGAMMVFNSTLILKNSNFSNNKGNIAGALLMDNVTIVYFGNLNFSNNELVSGGTTSTFVSRTTNRFGSSEGTPLSTDVFKFVCFVGSQSGYANVTLFLENSSVNVPTDCSFTAGAADVIESSNIEDLQSKFNQTLQNNVTISVSSSNALEWKPILVSAKTVVVQPSSSVSAVQLTYDESLSNAFEVSTGTLTLIKLNVVLYDLGQQKSFVRLSGNGKTNLSSVNVSYSTAASGRKANRGDNGISTWVIYCEVGEVFIQNSSFSNFIFNGTGNVVYFNPASRATATLTIVGTNFRNITFHATFLQLQNGYPRFGLAIYAALLSSSSQLNLTQVSFSQTHAAIALIVPALSDISSSVKANAVSFDVVDEQHVYIGTQTDTLQNKPGNDICDENLEKSLAFGGITTYNIFLCIGGATSCTVSQTETVEGRKLAVCVDSEVRECENKAHEFLDGQGRCVLYSCENRRANTTTPRRCGPGCLLTENGVCVSQDQGCDDKAFEINGVFQCVQGAAPEAKAPKSNTVAIVVSVVVAVVVVIIVIAIVVVCMFRIKTLGYKKYEEGQAKPGQSQQLSSVPSAQQQQHRQQPQLGVEDKQDKEEDMEEEVEDV